jgi:hypothetical protein
MAVASLASHSICDQLSALVFLTGAWFTSRACLNAAINMLTLGEQGEAQNSSEWKKV